MRVGTDTEAPHRVPSLSLRAGAPTTVYDAASRHCDRVFCRVAPFHNAANNPTGYWGISNLWEGVDKEPLGAVYLNSH